MDEEIPYSELLVDVEDGIVVGLYHYLWMKDGKGRPCPDVNIPHTIVFTNGRPSVWYFTSAKERCIKRKNRANMSNATITEALAPSPKDAAGPASASGADHSSRLGASAPGRLGAAPQPSLPRSKSGLDAGRPAEGASTGACLGPWPHHGLVARFQGSMTLPHTGGGAGGAGGRTHSSGRRKKHATLELQEEAVEWFSRESLREVLPANHVVVHGVAALHEGVLQRFVQPRGQQHFSIRATWSPNACVVERRTAKAKLNDPRVPLADRLAAWDGPIWLTDHSLVAGSVLQGAVCRLCDNVAAHLADVSGGTVRVLRMVLYFAVDDANRIWLTHCGTLRTQRQELAVAAALGGASVALHPHLRMRFPHGVPLPAALRLRMPEGSASQAARGPGGAAGELGPQGSGLDLPAPSPAFSASKAAASEAGGGEDGGSAGPSGRFLCVLTGDMYPGSQRCEVTYKQLLQHWFSAASQLSNEGDRLRAMDAIPLAIRRANPSLTREWYLRVRSQPTFLYRTAPVCAEAAGQLTGMALEELQRSMRPPPQGLGLGVGASPASGPATGRSASGVGGDASPGGGGSGGGIMGAFSRQGTARASPAAALTPTLQQRPATALAQGSALSLPLPGPPGGGGSGPPSLGRPGSRQAPSHSQPALGSQRGPVLRSKSASASTGSAGGRAASAPTGPGAGGLGPPAGGMFLNPHGQPVPRYMAPIGMHAQAAAQAAAHAAAREAGAGSGGGALPSMLMPRENGAGAGSGAASPKAGAHSSAILAVYGPTQEQAADAAAAAAILPYEVLDAVEAEKSSHSPTAAAAAAASGAAFASPFASASAEPVSPTHRAAPAASTAAPPPPPSPPLQPAEADSPAAADPRPARSPSPTGAARPGTAAGATAFGSMLLPWGGAPAPAPAPSRLPSRRNPLRMSASSDTTELGSTTSMSEPSSPNGGPGPGSYHHSPHSASSPGPGGGPSTRMSPPRALTLQTIHEEGATPRQESPLGEPLHFPPPPRGAGSHSVPRMRPPTRGGTDRPPPPGAGAVGRRAGAAGHSHSHSHGHSHGHGHGVPYPYHAGSGSTVFAHRSLSESGELPLPLLVGAPSLNSTLASSAGSLSRRSTSTQAMLSTDDIRTLRELSEAYSAAERLTQQLLAQAHEILSEDGGSRAASAGTSPAHAAGGRTTGPPGGQNGAPAAGAAGGAGRPASRHGASDTGGAGGGSGARGGSGVGRPAGLPPTGHRLSSHGPSPLGQSQVSRQGSGGRRAAGVSSSDGSGAVAEGSQSLPPLLGRVSSGCRAAGAQGLSEGGAEAEAGAGAGQDAGAARGGAAPDIGLLTSAEADLLAEALQE